MLHVKRKLIAPNSTAMTWLEPMKRPHVHKLDEYLKRKKKEKEGGDMMTLKSKDLDTGWIPVNTMDIWLSLRIELMQHFKT